MKSRFFARAVPKFLLLVLMTVLAVSGASAARPDEKAYFDLITSYYEKNNKDFYEPLIQELSEFRYLYPRSVKSDSADFMTAMLLKERSDETAALAAFLKVVYLYPQSPLVPVCRTHLEQLAKSQKKGISSLFTDEELRLLKKYVLGILDGKAPSAGVPQGYYDYIQVLADAGFRQLTQYTINECLHYLYRLNYDLAADRVLEICGDMYVNDRQYYRALLVYRQVPLISPYGDAVAGSMLKIGDIYLEKLQNYQMARWAYNELANKFPAEIQTARASIKLADVDLAEKKYGEALVQLEDTGKRFAFPQIRMECYNRIARIYLKELKKPQQALSFFERVVSEFPSETRAAEALVEIGQIQERELRDWALAVDAYRRLAERYPDFVLTPKYLVQAAGLAEDRLKDKALALELYQRAVSLYPETEQGRSAAERARKLEKK